jgi:GntR family transcriptional regulator / MocR family aminotransferase
VSIPYIRLDRNSGVPLPEQIAREMVQAIRTGRLRPGESLPTVRRMSEWLEVSIETVQKAYHRLQREGWVISRPRHGTVVAPHSGYHVGDCFLSREQRRIELLLKLKQWADEPGWIPVSGISPPPDVQVTEGLKRVASLAVEAAFQSASDPMGLPALRERIQSLLTSRGLWCETERISVVSGTQQAVSLIAQYWITSRDVVAVPEMCYLPVKEALAGRGAKIVTYRVQPGEMDWREIENTIQREKWTWICVMPGAHYPTGIAWSEEEKRSFLEMASRTGISILEDDYYGELYLSEKPPLSLAALADEWPSDERPPVFYLCSFSPVLHPVLRIGYAVLPRERAESFRQAKYLSDAATSPVVQQLLLLFWKEMDLPRFLAKKRNELRMARDQTAHSLSRWLPRGYSFHIPRSGTNMWVFSPSGFDGLTFMERCMREHVFVMPDEAFAVDKPVSGFQIRFGHIPQRVLDEGIKRIGRVLATLPVEC